MSEKENHKVINNRKLIITADDFGASSNINEGIRKAAQSGRITAISAMTNFVESTSELVEISRQYPHIGIGVHLNIVTGKPVMPGMKIPTLVNCDEAFFPLNELLNRINEFSEDELEMELRAQVEILKKANIRVDHLSDQCGIISLYPPFFDIMRKLAVEYEVPIRSPLIASFECPDILSNSKLKKHGRQLVGKLALRAPFKALRLLTFCNLKRMQIKHSQLHEFQVLHPDRFIDCFWGAPDLSNFKRIINNLPAGVSEMVVHLGTNTRQNKYPTGLDIDYFENREKELETLLDKELPSFLSDKSVSLVNYSYTKELYDSLIHN